MALSKQIEEAFNEVQRQISHEMIKHMLVGSFHLFMGRDIPYPLVDVDELKSQAIGKAKFEDQVSLHHSGLAVLVGGNLDTHKHYHAIKRGPTKRMTKENLVFNRYLTKHSLMNLQQNGVM